MGRRRSFHLILSKKNIICGCNNFYFLIIGTCKILNINIKLGGSPVGDNLFVIKSSGYCPIVVVH